MDSQPVFVTTYEPDHFGEQALRLLESLRLFGGRFGDAPFCLVQTRRGGTMPKDHRVRASRFDAIIERTPSHRCDWYHYLTKIKAIAHAGSLFPRSRVVFLDSDTLVLDEPSRFAEPGGESNVLQAVEGRHESFERADDQANRRFWENVPWSGSTSKGSGFPFPYFNAGVFSFPSASMFADRALEILVQLLDSRIKHSDFGIHSFDEIALSIAAVDAGLKFDGLSSSYNQGIAGWNASSIRKAALEQSVILHYHGAQTGDRFPIFLELLSRHHPAAAEWLSAKQPIPPFSGNGLLGKSFAKTLRAGRALRRWLHMRQSISADESPKKN